LAARIGGWPRRTIAPPPRKTYKYQGHPNHPPPGKSQYTSNHHEKKWSGISQKSCSFMGWMSEKQPEKDEAQK
jgi:hypothetical protein